jgi:hypothetical protein
MRAGWIAGVIAMALGGAGFAGLGSAAAQPAGAPTQQMTVLRPNTPGPVVVSCDGLAPSAVKVVPAPLDRYAILICTRSGQAIGPLDGYAWMFEQGSMWLTSTNPKAPSKDDHYTEIAFKPLSPDELKSLRAELAKLNPNPDVLTRPILRFAVTTSWGAHKEVYLLPPPDGAAPDAHTLGMECLQGCRPITEDPWFFVIVPKPGP